MVRPVVASVRGLELPTRLLGKLLLVVAIALLVYAAVMFFADFRAVGESLRQLPLSSIALALTLASASFALRFLRWQRYLSVLDIRVDLLDSALIFICGLGMSITPGKAGELLKSVMLRQVAETPSERSLPILVAERITDATALLFLGSLALLPGWPGVLLVTGALAGGVGLGLLLSSHRLGTWFITQLSNLRWLAPHRARLVQLHSALSLLCSPARLLEGFILSCAAWGVHSLVLWSLAGVFPGAKLDLVSAFMIDSLPALAGALVMLPGGLGLTEASMTGGLVALGHGAVTPAVAAAITIAVRVTTLWWAVALGLGSLCLWQVRHRR